MNHILQLLTFCYLCCVDCIVVVNSNLDSDYSIFVIKILRTNLGLLVPLIFIDYGTELLDKFLSVAELDAPILMSALNWKKKKGGEISITLLNFFFHNFVKWFNKKVSIKNKKIKIQSQMSNRHCLQQKDQFLVDFCGQKQLGASTLSLKCQPIMHPVFNWYYPQIPCAWKIK